MRTVRIYQPGTYTCGQSIELSATASQHVAVVLRMQPGEQLTLFSGDNQEFSARITHIHKKHVSVEIQTVNPVNRESPCAIHLVQGIIKGDRMEWVIQKAIELGVTHISPVLTQHSAIKHDPDRLQKKHNQWQAIAISACEQSGRNYIPSIAKPCTLHEYFQTPITTDRWILDPYATENIRDSITPTPAITLLIGPEGGFHQDEMEQAKALDFKPISLGPRTLRAETASIVALSVLQAVAGDL
jgi:16S rRNA (uracil1498-N3)-methyltransferase